MESAFGNGARMTALASCAWVMTPETTWAETTAASVVSGADTAFDDKGNLTDPKKREGAMNVGRDVVARARKLAAG